MTALLGAWSTARRIVAIRLDSLGDVLMMTPALRALAQANPSGHLALLASRSGAAAAPLLPDLGEVLVHEPSWTNVAADDGGAADRALVEALRAGRFDGAVIFTTNTQSSLPAALACRLAGIPLRLAHARENPYRLLSDWVPDPEPIAPVRHEVRRQLDLVGTIGARVEDEHLSIRVPPADARWIRGRLAERGIRADRRWAVIHPGARAASRRYPTERFATVARALVAHHGWSVVTAGAGDDRARADEVVAGLGPAGVSFGDELDVGRLAALLAVAPVLIANNSAPAHLAAAVGTPVVDLYALTNLQHAPWGVPSRVLAHDVPCKGCARSACPLGHHACLLGVDPAQVVEAALELVAGRVAGGPPPAGVLAPMTPAPSLQLGGPS